MFSYLLQDTAPLHAFNLQKDLSFSPYCRKPVTCLIMWTTSLSSFPVISSPGKVITKPVRD